MATTNVDLDAARSKALETFMKDINSSKNGSSVFTKSSGSLGNVEAISTGAPMLDWILGVGGVPKGRIVEIYGPAHAGKTSIALSICGEAIKAGGMAGYIDVENAITFEHAEWMGINTDYFVVSQPESGEDALELVEEMCKTNLFDVLVIDSVAGLVPRKELEGDIGDLTVGETARLMSRGLRKLSGVAARSNTTLVFINQIREKIGVSFGNPETTTGGRSLPFYASVRIEVRSSPSKQIKEGTGTSQKVVGQTCVAKTVKNKVAPPFKSCEYNLLFDHGIDVAASLVDVAIEAGIWERAGASYTNAKTGELIERGKEKVIARLRQDPQLVETLKEDIKTLRESRIQPEGETDAEQPGEEGDVTVVTEVGDADWS